MCHIQLHSEITLARSSIETQTIYPLTTINESRRTQAVMIPRGQVVTQRCLVMTEKQHALGLSLALAWLALNWQPQLYRSQLLRLLLYSGWHTWQVR